ncbi:hypothetical protein [Rhodocyclus tenuis]|uniref:hypothetical protein n=1 Tax=Rhodocyclus tenuis TaxID=1066 RepID=UPI0019053B78|nr:hypothetical protein [Rhodocyclus tenuis]
MLVVVGCSTTPIGKREASSPRLDRVFDKGYLAKTTDCRPVHLTRDAGLVLIGFEHIVLIDGKPVVALKSAESIEICLSPAVHMITAIPASDIYIGLTDNRSLASYKLYDDPQIRGDLEIDTRPDMRFNVRIWSAHTGGAQKTRLDYIGERMVR